MPVSEIITNYVNTLSSVEQTHLWQIMKAVYNIADTDDIVTEEEIDSLHEAIESYLRGETVSDSDIDWDTPPVLS